MVYASDLQKIIDAARAFPNAKLYVCDKTWNEEDQFYFLADSPEHALKMHDDAWGEDNEDRFGGPLTIDDFSHGDI